MSEQAVKDIVVGILGFWGVVLAAVLPVLLARWSVSKKVDSYTALQSYSRIPKIIEETNDPVALLALTKAYDNESYALYRKSNYSLRSEKRTFFAIAFEAIFITMLTMSDFLMNGFASQTIVGCVVVALIWVACLLICWRYAGKQKESNVEYQKALEEHKSRSKAGVGGYEDRADDDMR